MSDQEQIEDTVETAETRETAVAVDPVEQLHVLTAERDQLAQEKSELYERLLRKQAEFDNFRRRTEREREEIGEYASMEAVRPLLAVLDDFERGLKAAADTEGAGQEFVKGVELIYSRLLDSLKKLGLEPIESTGMKFDPNLHHGVQKTETDEVEDQTVLEEHQKGYNFRGKLLRPAMVRVSVHS